MASRGIDETYCPAASAAPPSATTPTKLNRSPATTAKVTLAILMTCLLACQASIGTMSFLSMPVGYSNLVSCVCKPNSIMTTDNASQNPNCRMQAETDPDPKADTEIGTVTPDLLCIELIDCVTMGVALKNPSRKPHMTTPQQPRIMQPSLAFLDFLLFFGSLGMCLLVIACSRDLAWGSNK